MSVDIKTGFNKKVLAIAGVIVVIALVGAYFAFIREDNKTPKYPEIVTQSTDDPDEGPLDDFVWSGGPNDPKRITLPTINAGGYIQRVGIDQRKEVAVPTNVNLAGWFIKTAIPGEKGYSVIDGHVDGRTKPGIFKNLHTIKRGAIFEVEFGNGRKQEFKVTDVIRTDIQGAPALLFNQDPTVTSQLNLITCGGRYDKQARRYLERYIVTSVPV